jgi:hypothetical protein
MRVQDLDLPLFGTLLGGAIYMGPFWRENQSVWTPGKKKKRLQRRAHDLEDQDAS